VLVNYLKFKDITFYNLSVYHYNLHKKQKCIIFGWDTQNEVEVCAENYPGEEQTMPCLLLEREGKG